jgi:hypothetical protein
MGSRRLVNPSHPLTHLISTHLPHAVSQFSHWPHKVSLVVVRFHSFSTFQA